MRYLKIVGLLLLGLLLTSVVLQQSLPRESNPQFIPAFSSAQARYVGLNPQTALEAIFNDFSPRQVRLQANWNEIEKTLGVFDFTDIDWQVAEAGRRHILVTMAVGRKLPRWPECHDPIWVRDLKSWELNERLEIFLRATVDHYKNNSAIVRWQLENEPLFAYGNCPPPNRHRLQTEREIMRQLDTSRPVLITESGELSSWLEAAQIGDELGVTMYRVTWNPFFKYQTYPLPAVWYRLKGALASLWVNKIVVSELQMEPWGPQGLVDLTPEQIKQSFSIQQFNNNINYFKRTGFSEAFLWGVEWWYKMKLSGNPEYWQAGQELFGR